GSPARLIGGPGAAGRAADLSAAQLAGTPNLLSLLSRSSLSGIRALVLMLDAHVPRSPLSAIHSLALAFYPAPSYAPRASSAHREWPEQPALRRRCLRSGSHQPGLRSC